MKKAIVTTTINPPTEALKRFIKIAKADGWHLFIVGDLTTDHKPYENIAEVMDCVTYVSPAQQVIISPELSEAIGWQCIQRRNFGLIAACQWGADIIATVDDDNIPDWSWGKNCKVNTDYSYLIYPTNIAAFDPLSPIFPAFWHRGFPVQLLDRRILGQPRLQKRRVLVQADFWHGDPDVDAICRIALQPSVEFNANLSPFGSNAISPFNSQNTFLSREVFPTYFLFPDIGRMDDIWASYVTQFEFPDSVMYSRASVFQARNPHNLYKDLEAEMLGYAHNLEFVQSKNDWQKFLPERSLKAYEIYKTVIKETSHAAHQ